MQGSLFSPVYIVLEFFELLGKGGILGYLLFIQVRFGYLSLIQCMRLLVFQFLLITTWIFVSDNYTFLSGFRMSFPF